MFPTTRRQVRFPVLPYHHLAVLVALLLLAGPSSAAAVGTVRPDDARALAQACEKRGEWLEACRLYDEILRKDRTNAEARGAYQRCLRQYHIAKRHNDRAYREALGRLTPSQALDVYEQVLATVAATYVDRGKADLNVLFQHGVQELRYALAQDVFVREYLTARPGALEAFKARLAGWPERKLGNRAEVRDLILSLANVAYEEGLVVKQSAFAVVLALEFTCGACNGLDEYTLFLTPGHFQNVQAALRGKVVGVGLDLAVVERRLVISRVYPNGPADAARVSAGERVLRIDQQLVENLPAEVAAELLRGEADSDVYLTVEAPDQTPPERTYKLARRPVAVPSVEFRMLDDDMGAGDYVGYVRISSFQESTVQEVKEALAQLQTLGMRGLVLDLRGNPGGSFLAGVKVAELFLPDGVIVNTMSQLKEFNKPYRVESKNPLLTPLCVLVDGDTASSAELVAGALKEHNRAKLIGQTTFGKGTIQCVIPLDKTPGGIRITVARFTSPRKHPYSGVGIAPHILIEPDGDAAVRAARVELRGLLGMMGM